MPASDRKVWKGIRNLLFIINLPIWYNFLISFKYINLCVSYTNSYYEGVPKSERFKTVLLNIVKYV